MKIKIINHAGLRAKLWTVKDRYAYYIHGCANGILVDKNHSELNSDTVSIKVATEILKEQLEKIAPQQIKFLRKRIINDNLEVTRIHDALTNLSLKRQDKRNLAKREASALVQSACYS